MLLAGLNEPRGYLSAKRILQPCILVGVDLLIGCDLFGVIWIFRFVILLVIARQQERHFIPFCSNFRIYPLSVDVSFWGSYRSVSFQADTNASEEHTESIFCCNFIL